MRPEPMKFDTIRKHLPKSRWFGKWEVLRGLKEQEARIAELEARLQKIGDLAHEKSTGPTVPDGYWEIRDLAYNA